MARDDHAAIISEASSDAYVSQRPFKSSSLLRCLLLGDRGILEIPPEIQPVYDASEPHDAILTDYREPCFDRVWHDFEDLVRLSPVPAAPVISANGPLGGRADLVLDFPTRSSLASALHAIEPLRARLGRLPSCANPADRPGLAVLAWAVTRAQPLEAAWHPGLPEAIHYPELLGITDVRTLLERLADQGLLRRRFFERLFVCGTCRSQRLLAREVCPDCDSSHLDEKALIHHYQCGFQATERHFVGNHDGYSCPKCRRTLQHYGVDYDKPGCVIECRACGNVFDEPEANFICLDCGAEASADRSSQRDWYHYELTGDGLAAVQAGMLDLDRSYEERSPGQMSFKEFTRLAAHHCRIARQHARPLAALKVTMDRARLCEIAGIHNAAAVSELVAEVVGRQLLSSDFFVAAEDGLLVCLPERDHKATADFVERLSLAIHRSVRPDLAAWITVTSTNAVERLIGSDA